MGTIGALPFVLFIGVAVSLEIGISVWAPTHLVAEGRGVEAAATVVGIYFGAFTATRFLVAPLAARWDLGQLVRGVRCTPGGLFASKDPAELFRLKVGRSGNRKSGTWADP